MEKELETGTQQLEHDGGVCRKEQKETEGKGKDVRRTKKVEKKAMRTQDQQETWTQKLEQHGGVCGKGAERDGRAGREGEKVEEKAMRTQGQQKTGMHRVNKRTEQKEGGQKTIAENRQRQQEEQIG